MTPLRLARIEKGLTLVEVAAAVDINPSQLSRIERGYRTRPETAERLSQFLGISEEAILFPHRFSSDSQKQTV